MPISAEEARCAGCPEATEEELLVQLDDVLKEYADVPGALIPVLQIAQAMFGYLPEAALKKIALALDKPYSEVAGVVGFYSFFTTVPRGKHLVRVCLGTACYVRGGKQVLAALKDVLRIEVGETTSDRLFSLDVGRCFGACGLSPVIMIDDDVHQRVKPARLAKILDQYRETSAPGRRGRRRRMTQIIANAKELTILRDAIRAEKAKQSAQGHKQIRLCLGASCIASGALKVQAALEKALADRQLEQRVSIVGTGCLGPCSGGPALMIDDVFYEKLRPQDAKEIVSEHLGRGRIVERLTHKRPDGRAVANAVDMDFFRRQKKIVLRNCGLIDPQRIEDYIARDGYQALAKALTRNSPETVIETMRQFRAARPRRRRFPDLAEVEVHPRGPRRARNTWSATPTRATPGRSWTAACWKAIRTA